MSDRKYNFTDRNEILNSLRGLIQIDSTSRNAGEKTDEAPLGERINQAINYVLDLGDDFGFRTKNLDGYSGWVEMGPEDAEEMIGIIGHVDTVPVGDDWNYPPYDLTIDDGKMYGRGTNDDKGPVIASLYAMKAIEDSDIPLTRRVRLIVGGDEEVGDWLCMERYKETEELPTYAFTPDANYPVIFAEKGILHLKFKKDNPKGDSILLESGTVPNIVPDKAKATVEGKEYYTEGVASHAMEPELGENAMLKLGEILTDAGIENDFLDLLARANTVDLGIDIEDEPSGKLTYNPAIGHVDENEATLVSDIRYPVTFSSSDFLPNIEKAVGELGYVVEVLDDIAPTYMEKDSELIQKLTKVYNDYTGDNLEPIAIGGGTYAKAFDNAVAFGVIFPGEPDMCHKRDEFWAVDSFFKNIEIITEAINSLAGE